MNWENIANEFEEKLNNDGVAYSHKQGMLMIVKKFELWEDLIGVKFEDWNKYIIMNLFENGTKPKKEFILKYEKLGIKEEKLTKLAKGICNGSYYVFSSRIRYANKVTEFLNRLDLKMNIKDFNVDIRADLESIFTKEELINDVCFHLSNIQDKFILYALFSGIRGNKYSDLTELKVKDVNFDTKEIKLPSGITVKMDDYLEDLLTDLLDPEFGLHYFALNRSGNYSKDSVYEFNMKSEYVLKVKPTSTNKNGINPMSYQGIQTRLKGLSSVLNRKILGSDLYKSGVIYNLHMSNPERTHFTQSEVEKFINENNYKITMFEVKRAFEDKYGEN